MCRVNNSIQKRKQKIKETLIGLSLAISIGFIGSAGSYAYFSDRVETDNGIMVTMGTLDVGIGTGFNLDEFNKHQEYTQEFLITNTGTLDEILTLTLKVKEGNEYLSEFDYTLQIADESPMTYTLEELSKGVKIGRLNSSESIECNATLINSTIEQNYEQDIKITFDLVVEGVQINDDSVQESGGAN
ncbi:Uncharacterised protein [Turicibacter sanguinis]|nr:Uncharacterised protein [Turicibacter sanguinis]